MQVAAVVALGPHLAELVEVVAAEQVGAWTLERVEQIVQLIIHRKLAEAEHQIPEAEVAEVEMLAWVHLAVKVEVVW